MATITFLGESFEVDHAVKGEDYVHGYDAAGHCIISIDGVKDFSLITYDGVYMNPRECLSEPCNSVKYCGGKLKTADGQEISSQWQLIGAWGYGGSLSTDFTQYSELLFVYDAKNDKLANCGTSFVVPTDILNGSSYVYIGAQYSDYVRFVVKLNQSNASTYNAYYGGNSNSAYKIYCYGRSGGATGATGAAGATGADSVSISSVEQTTTSTEDGGINVVTVTLTNGSTSTFTVKNGSRGGDGTDGKTPVKGTDYWTDADKTEMVNSVLAALPTWTGGSY